MKTFLLLHDFSYIFDMLRDDEAGQLIKAVFRYETLSEEPCFNDRAMQMAFFNIRRFLDSNREHYEKVCSRRSANASKRWLGNSAEESKNKAVQKDANAYNCIQKDAFAGNTDVNADVNSNTDSDVNVNTDATQGTREKTQTQKMPYGEFRNVYLTREEYDIVKNRMFEGERRLQSLSAYMKSTGKTYRDHYAQLINWHFYGNGKSHSEFTEAKQKPPGERREPTFDVSEFTKRAVGIKYIPPQDEE